MSVRSTIWVTSLALTVGCELVANLSGDRRFEQQPSASGGAGMSGVDASMDVSQGGAPIGTSAGGDAGAATPPIVADGAAGAAGSSHEAAPDGGVSPDAGPIPYDAGPMPRDAGGISRDGGPGAAGPSCAHMKGTECSGESCCRAPLVPGGTFWMGRSASGSDAVPAGDPNETPEHWVTVSPFRLDEFEVTVGRFRRFFEAYDGTPPDVDDGANPHVLGSGWNAGWNQYLPATRDALRNALFCNTDATWTSEASVNETLPIDCLTWYEAFAFCSWDGGRLPTEAEWEYAAAGGPQNRMYPWGSEIPSEDGGQAVFDCVGGGTPGECQRNDRLPVGSRRGGAGRYGQMDLAGSMSELVLDWYDVAFYARPEATGRNVVDLLPSNERYRVFRGGAYDSSAFYLRAAARFDVGPLGRYSGIGVRCARDP